MPRQRRVTHRCLPATFREWSSKESISLPRNLKRYLCLWRTAKVRSKRLFSLRGKCAPTCAHEHVLMTKDHTPPSLGRYGVLAFELGWIVAAGSLLGYYADQYL